MLWIIIYVYVHYAPSLMSVAHKTKILSNTVDTCWNTIYQTTKTDFSYHASFIYVTI